VGRDTDKYTSSANETCFNPRARVGRDLSGQTAYARIYKFQSTRPRGARRIETAMQFVTGEFQSTRPRGARRIRICIDELTDCRFNPRARVGRDYMHFNYMHYIKIIQ